MGMSETKALRNALGAFATGVTIVTTRGADGGDAGLTANSFSSVSLDPPMVLWSLGKTSSSIDAFRAAGHFAVHILAADQDALSGRFASKGIDRFAGLDLGRGHGGIPLLLDCTARFECRTAFQYEGGDHVIFVGEVLDFTHSERPPLVFHGGRYGTVIKKDTAQAAPALGAESSLSSDDLIYHVSRAFHQIRQGALEERRRVGWTESEYAVLSVLGREDDKTVAEIDAIARFHDWQVTPEAVAALATQGLVAVAEPVGIDGRVRLTQDGRHAIVRIIAILKAAEADALQGFDVGEVQLLKQLLRRVSEKSELKLQAALRKPPPDRP